MDKEKNDLNEKQSNNGDEMNWELFSSEEQDEEWEREKEQRRKKWSRIRKIVGSIIVITFIVSGLQLWFHIFNLPSIEFLKVSKQLSEEKRVQEYRKAIVTIESGESKGTGFNISPDGFIVTNQHVVDQEELVHVYFPEKGSYVGKVVYANPNLDLAVVEIDSENLPIISVSSEENWQTFIGEDILFIGNPLAHTQIANVGTITGEVNLRTIEVPVMEITAPVYKGNSGSPVINESGEVIGIVFATLKSSTSDSNEIKAVAVPSIYLIEVLDMLSEKQEE